MSTSNAPGTKVANGQHVVPEGIAVEEFTDGDSKTLVQICPEAVRELLSNHGLMPLYDKLIKKASTCSQEMHGKKIWSISKLVLVLQDFQDSFQQKEVRTELCKYTTPCGTYRWLWWEFIDNSRTPSSYLPNYCVSNYIPVLDGVAIIPPKGVAVIPLSGWKNTLKVCPPEVEIIIEPKGLITAYDKLAVDLNVTYKKKTKDFMAEWKLAGVNEVLQEYHWDTFAAKNVDVVVCSRKSLKWLEFIDEDSNPDYVPEMAISDHRRESVSRRHSVENLRRMAVEDLVVDGVVKLGSECPALVQELLEKKGLMDVYPQLDECVDKAKGMRNFVDIWRLTAAEVVEFAILTEMQSKMKDKGVKLILCESIGSEARSQWIEFIDLENDPDYSSPYDIIADRAYAKDTETDKKATEIGGGWYKVPREGVAAVQLRSAQKMSSDCPADVDEFLNSLGVKPLYEDLIDAILSSKKTRNWADSWSTKEIRAIHSEFYDQFLSRGVKVVLCKLTPDAGKTLRWFEFVDINVAPAWVPQYDVAMDGGSEVDTFKTTLTFPKGVAVEAIMDRKSIIEKTPGPVKELIEKKACMDLYRALIEVLCKCAAVAHKDDLAWSRRNIIDIADVLGPKFEAKGGELFPSGHAAFF